MNLICDVSDSESCEVDVGSKEDFDKIRLEDYPEFPLHNIITKVKNLFSTARDIDEENWYLDFRYTMSNVRRYIVTNYQLKFDITEDDLDQNIFNGINVHDVYGGFDVRLADVVKYMFEHDSDIPDKFKYGNGLQRYDYEKFYKTVWIVSQCMQILKMKDDIIKVLDFISEFYDVDRNFRYKLETAINDVKTYTDEFKNFVYNCLDQHPRVIGVANTVATNVVDSFIENEKNINKQLKDFHPVNILDKYDAGWLAPDGEFFGMNGEKANMLHMTLADAIMDYYGWKKPEGYSFSVDFWLARQGFVKIDHNWILYEAYDECLDEKIIPMTPIQRRKIVDYGNLCYNQKLFFGYDKEFCSAPKFETMDDEMIAKLVTINK